MASLLGKTGIADDVYNTMHVWFGSLRGGLAIGTVAVCTIFAAMVGTSAAGTLGMGMIAYPAMRKRGYAKDLAIGCIPAGGGLGVLIPPSVVFIFYGLITRVSVGWLFFGGLLPGLLLASLYMSYIGMRCALQPHLGPSLPPEERGSWKDKLVAARAIVAQLFVVFSVLGGIYSGIFTPTEASAIGVAVVAIISLALRRLTWQKFKEALTETFTSSTFILWCLIGVACFDAAFYAWWGRELGEFIAGLAINRWLILIGMQLFLFFLGMIMDEWAMMMIFAPIFSNIIISLGFNPVWFGIVFVINMQMALISPPYGFGLFCLRSFLPRDVKLLEIYHSVLPYLGLQVIGLALVMIFPQIALLLPSTMRG